MTAVSNAEDAVAGPTAEKVKWVHCSFVCLAPSGYPCTAGHPLYPAAGCGPAPDPLNSEHLSYRNLAGRIRRLRQLKDAGKEAFDAGEYKDAVDWYTEALKIDKGNRLVQAVLYLNRGLAHYKVRRCEEPVCQLWPRLPA